MEMRSVIPACSDEELEREIRQGVLVAAFLWCSPGQVRVEVRNGCATLSGEVESRDVAELVTSAVERVPGVRSVRSRLRWASPR